MFRESIKMSVSNIMHNKMRSFLTTLGIIIGVASVIALITIVQGATSSVTSQISALGADKLTVQALGTPLKQGLNDQDLADISKVKNVSGVSPSVSGTTSIVYNGDVETGISILGKNEVYFQKNADILASGRTIDSLDVQNNNQVAVIGSQIATDLFFGEEPVNKQMIVDGNSYTIIGVLKARTGFSMSFNE